MRPIKQFGVVSTHSLQNFAPQASLGVGASLMLTRVTRFAFMFISAAMLVYAYPAVGRGGWRTFWRRRPRGRLHQPGVRAPRAVRHAGRPAAPGPDRPEHDHHPGRPRRHRPPAALIRTQVESLIAAVHRECPHSRLAVLTVFPRGVPSPAAVVTDRTIVAAARHADPGVIVFDPIASHWQFPRIGDQLHPTPAGHVLDRAGTPDRAGATHRAISLTDRAAGHDPGSWLNALSDLG